MTETKVTHENIHDLIDQWHEGTSEKELHDYLGLTIEQYAHWVEIDKLPND